MSKVCDTCGAEYKGFGTTCSSCRCPKNKTLSPKQCCSCHSFFTGTGSTCSDCGPADPNKCVACGKVAYAMERISVEGQTFHATCFKCAHCNRKISAGGFSKGEDGTYYCKPHYQQLFKMRGRYSISKSKTANLQAANLKTLGEALEDAGEIAVGDAVKLEAAAGDTADQKKEAPGDGGAKAETGGQEEAPGDEGAKAEVGGQEEATGDEGAKAETSGAGDGAAEAGDAAAA